VPKESCNVTETGAQRFRVNGAGQILKKWTI